LKLAVNEFGEKKQKNMLFISAQSFLNTKRR